MIEFKGSLYRNAHEATKHHVQKFLLPVWDESWSVGELVDQFMDMKWGLPQQDHDTMFINPAPDREEVEELIREIDKERGTSHLIIGDWDKGENTYTPQIFRDYGEIRKNMTGTTKTGELVLRSKNPVADYDELTDSQSQLEKKWAEDLQNVARLLNKLSD